MLSEIIADEDRFSRILRQADRLCEYGSIIFQLHYKRYSTHEISDETGIPQALKHQGKRHDLASDQVGQKLGWAINQVAEDAGESKTQVQRFIRLNSLNPELQEMVDEGRLWYASFILFKRHNKLLSHTGC